MVKMRKGYIILGVMVVVGLASFLIPIFVPDSSFNPNTGTWGLFVFIITLLTVAAFLSEFERISMSSKEMGFIAILGAVSAVSRVPFAVVPGVQPSTFIIICTGYVFGPIAGFMVGAITPLISNLFLGMGPWTLYQILAWGLVGFTAGFIDLKRNWKLFLVGFMCGYFYGWITNMWFWSSFIYPLNLNTFLAVQVNSLWFDSLHAFGNVVFLWVFGPKTIRIFERYRGRFHIERI